MGILVCSAQRGGGRGRGQSVLMVASQLVLMVTDLEHVLMAPPPLDEVPAQMGRNHPVAVLSQSAQMGPLSTRRPGHPVLEEGQSAAMGPALSVEMGPGQVEGGETKMKADDNYFSLFQNQDKNWNLDSKLEE